MVKMEKSLFDVDMLEIESGKLNFHFINIKDYNK
jgi:hypothetical protein